MVKNSLEPNSFSLDELHWDMHLLNPIDQSQILT